MFWGRLDLFNQLGDLFNELKVPEGVVAVMAHAWKQPPTTRLTARKSRANKLYALRAILQVEKDDRLRLADSYVMAQAWEPAFRLTRRAGWLWRRRARVVAVMAQAWKPAFRADAA